MQRTKTYIAFDGDSDLMSYRTIQSWSSDSKVPFQLNDAHDVNNANDDSLPESIIKQLKERLDFSKHLVLIIGSQTNKNKKGILKYEINYAIRNKIPVFLVFKGYVATTATSKELWENKLVPKLPAVIKEKRKEMYALVCPFTQNAVINAINQYSNNNLPAQGFTWYWK